jgi:autotransporter-associated beta strand protein
MVISGSIQLGAGGITVKGAGGTNTVTLSGINSYTGETRVQTGTLKLTGNARFHDASTVRIDAGAILNLDFTGSDAVATLYLGGVKMPDGTYGSLTSTAANKSAYYSGEGMLQVGGYAPWAALNSVTGGPNGDSDHDGVKNLIEYALVDGGERGVLIGTTINFTKRGEPYGGDLTYIIETSANLEPNSWLPAVTHGPAQLGTPISYDLTSASGNPKIFVRLKVAQAP